MLYKIINVTLKKILAIILRLIIPNSIYSDSNIKNTVSLYKSKGFGGLSANIRFWDSPLVFVETITPDKGKILDLGCGEGVLTNYLALCKPSRSIIGMEISHRIKLANHGLKNVKFLQGNVLKDDLPACDVIITSHLLHHLPSQKSQEELIKKCYQRLEKGGKLIILEINREFSFRYFIVWITDVFIVPILFEGQLSNMNVFHRQAKDWKNILLKTGFKIKLINHFKKGPFPDILFICQK